MDAGNMRLVADFIEKLPEEKFDMQWVSTTGRDPRDCGTAGCIAGWTQSALGQSWSGSEGAWHGAMSLLGLNRAEAEHVFCGWWSRVGLQDITSEEAADYLRLCAETGTVYCTDEEKPSFMDHGEHNNEH